MTDIRRRTSAPDTGVLGTLPKDQPGLGEIAYWASGLSPAPVMSTSKVAGLGRDSLMYYGGAASLSWSVACVDRPHSPN